MRGAQVLEEFPHLDTKPRNWAKMIGAGSGRRPLASDLLKVSHHASKRGVNLELLERMGDRGAGPGTGPRFLVSSCAWGPNSGYGFPHRVTQELLRGVRDPQAQRGAAHPPDDRLGIHYTSQALDTGGPAGSLAYVVDTAGGASLYRFGDSVSDRVNLKDARRLKA